MTMAAGELLDVSRFLTNRSTDLHREHYLCSTTALGVSRICCVPLWREALLASQQKGPKYTGDVGYMRALIPAKFWEKDLPQAVDERLGDGVCKLSKNSATLALAYGIVEHLRQSDLMSIVSC